MFTPITINKTSAVIMLTQGKTALIDPIDWPKISSHRWHLTSNGYAARWKSIKGGAARAMLFMHREILLPSGKMEVDHINRNPLDNRRINLRESTSSQNKINRGLQKNNTTGYLGVCRNHTGFQARIKVNRKVMCLGTFRTARDAAQVRDSHAKRLFGNFAILNFPEVNQ